MLGDIVHIIKKNYSEIFKEDKLYGIIWYFAIPMILSIVLTLNHIVLTKTHMRHIVSFVAIVTGFLINAIVMLRTNNKHNKKNPQKQILDSKTYSNIFYTILVGIFLIILVLVFCSVPSSKLIVILVFSGILYTTLTHFIIMLITIVVALFLLYKEN